jgi:hypothetical protein
LIVSEDRQEENKELMNEIELAMAQKNREQAKRLIEKIRSKVQTGVFFLTATQYLALLLKEEGEMKGAYDLLLPIKDHLEDRSRCLLHELASYEKNDSLVAELSADAYQIEPNQEVALRNARSFASLNQPKAAGGWLHAAWQLGSIDLKAILEEKVFLSVKDQVEFKEFTDSMNA